MKDRLLERRSTLIEELIKSDHTYRPPADYRPAKKHRKVRHRCRWCPLYHQGMQDACCLFASSSPSEQTACDVQLKEYSYFCSLT